MTSIEFQAVDWYGTDIFPEEESDSDSDSDRQKSSFKIAESYDVFLFGRTKENKSVALRINGFEPYLFIRVPNSFTQKHVFVFEQYLKRKKRLLKTTLVRTELIQRFPFKGFTNKTVSKFMKCTFLTKQAMNTCRYIFQKCDKILMNAKEVKANHDAEFEYRSSPRKVRIPGLNQRPFLYELYESNIDPLLRLAHLREISSSGWIHAKKCTPTSFETECDIVMKCNWTHLFPVQGNTNVIGPIRTCAFDIECTSSHGDFPQAKKTYDTPAREIITDIQRLTSVRRTILDKWAFDSVMNTSDIRYHQELLRQYIKYIFGMKTRDDIDLSRIHNVCTKRDSKPSEEQISVVIAELMRLCNTYDQIKSSDNPLSSSKNKSLLQFIKKEEKQIPDIFINYAQAYGAKGISVVNKLRNRVIERVAKIFDDHFGMSTPIEGDAVVQISNCIYEYGSSQPYKKVLFTLGECDDIDDMIVHKCVSERDLLISWRNFIQKDDPDVLSGYNSFGFDLPYMYNRAVELGIVDQFAKLSKLSDHVSVMKKKRLASAALGDNIWYDVPIIGRIHVDIMKVVQRDFNLSSWKLDYVSSYFMNGSLKNLTEIGDDTHLIETDNTRGLLVDSYINFQINNGLTTDMYGDPSKFKVLEITQKTITVQGSLKIEEIDFKKYKCKWCHAKDDMEYSAIFKAFNATDITPTICAERAKVGRYCMKDSILCIDLMKKLEIIANNIGMSNVCSVPLSWIFSRGQGAKTLSLVAKQCLQDGFLVPVVYMEKGKDPEYEGAIVLDPEPGIYLNSAIATLDYASLYPSCIISENMSHDTIVLEDKWKGEKGGVALRKLGYGYIDIEWDVFRTSGNKKIRTRKETTRFVQSPDGSKGIIPRILQSLLVARKRARKKIKYKTVTTKAQKTYSGLYKKRDNGTIEMNTEDGVIEIPESDIEKVESTYSDFQQGILDGLQKAYKITANSIYGQMGAKTSPVKMIPIAACTTATGRKLLLLARNKIREEYSNKTLVLPNDQTIFIRSAKTIYGDTDSVFIKFSIYDEKGGKKLTGKELLYAAIQSGIHSSKYATKFLKAPHDLEYEKAFYPFILLSKKRYVGMKYEFDVNKCKQTSMGIVLKRRDNAKILKFVFGGAIDIIMKEQNIHKAFRFVQDIVLDIIAGKYGMDYLIITKSLRSGYKNPESIAHKVLADRMGDRDPGNRPQSNDRIPYVFIVKSCKKGEKILQGNRIESPDFIQKNNLDIDYQFYITNQICKPVSQVFALIIKQLPGYRPQKKMLQLQKKLSRTKNEDEIKKLKKRMKTVDEVHAGELLFANALRKIRNQNSGQKEITHFMNIVMPCRS